MKRQTALTLISLLAMALLTISGVWAQDVTPEATADVSGEATPEVVQKVALSYGTPVTGEITATVFEQRWTLRTASADRVQVRVERTDGNLIPDVNILDASGASLSSSYGADYTYAAAEIEDYTLPAAGEYVVQVTRYNGEDGATTGGYTLAVTPLGTSQDNPNNQTVVGEVQADTPVTGEITATHWLYLYTYNAPAADALDVVVTRTGGTLRPYVDVLDANGLSLRTGYNDYDVADTGEFELPAPGAYTIAVSRYNGQDGDSLGTFELTVNLVGSGEGSPLLAGAAGDVTYDQELTGSVSSAQWYQDWTLTTKAGDSLTVTVERTSGNLVPEVAVLGGSGQELRRGYADNTGATADTGRFSLDGPGTYTIRVTRSEGQTGETSGAYALTVALNGTGEGAPSLEESVGEVTLGEAVEGEITNAQWENSWTFNATNAGSISVQVTRTDGTLVPTLDIRDMNNQSLRTGYYNDTRDAAEITSYQLPSTGEYRIVVVRDGGQDGYTSGGYRLLVRVSK